MQAAAACCPWLSSSHADLGLEKVGEAPLGAGFRI